MNREIEETRRSKIEADKVQKEMEAMAASFAARDMCLLIAVASPKHAFMFTTMQGPARVLSDLLAALVKEVTGAMGKKIHKLSQEAGGRS